jgi:site-specific DNA-cytosine methylase
MLDWLMSKRPECHVWESVLELLKQANQDNLDWLVNQFFVLGYVVAYCTLKSSHYGHPTGRERAYGLCLNFKKMNMTPPQAMVLATRIMEFVRTTMKLPSPVGLRWFLLSCNSDHVRMHTEHLAASVKAAGREQLTKDLEWRKKMQTFCGTVGPGISYARLKTPDVLATSLYFLSLPLREQHGISAHFAKLKGLADVVAIETSQSVERMYVVTDEILNTITPESRYTLFPPLTLVPRGLTGVEACSLIGLPQKILTSFVGSSSHMMNRIDSDRLLYNMSGNAFSGGVIGAILISVFLHMDPKHLKVDVVEPAPKTLAELEQESKDIMDLLF